MGVKQKSVCNEQYYKMLFEENIEIIRNFIFYKCGDMSAAEDIAQDAFIKLWNNCQKVVFEKAKSFLMKVAQNQFYNEQKHKKVKLNYNKQKYNHQITSSSINNPQFVMEEKEFMKKLETSIADLPAKQREVFLLSRIDKKTYIYKSQK